MQPFTPGQIWTYKTRPGEEASRVIICRVEENKAIGQIVHIHISGLHVKNRHLATGESTVIGHMPYDVAALRQSLLKLESSSSNLPDFEDGYQEWRTAFDQNKAGIWTAPLTQAIDAIESGLNQ